MRIFPSELGSAMCSHLLPTQPPFSLSHGDVKTLFLNTRGDLHYLV